MTHLKVEEMKDGYTYIIQARNANVGVWDEHNKCFFISRHKFGSNFLDKEYHWDTGAPYGTARPMGEIEKAPTNQDDLLDYLNEIERR